ncbi:hypothetical protein T265_10059 [Opisthorchis viverrini]|uniref:Uncharacterized protein n=1 Tax=Opisthorchis viverrini TaxID=6198 RepID=A0A074Z803_OPIVI|nr:hypothetical protein T265_10059 [Opisthorchis viverrini]KER21667.1 hypothetical protein T265_10059 [Opisthorchis viverrini]
MAKFNKAPLMNDGDGLLAYSIVQISVRIGSVGVQFITYKQRTGDYRTIKRCKLRGGQRVTWPKGVEEMKPRNLRMAEKFSMGGSSRELNLGPLLRDKKHRRSSTSTVFPQTLTAEACLSNIVPMLPHQQRHTVDETTFWIQGLQW